VQGVKTKPPTPFFGHLASTTVPNCENPTEGTTSDVGQIEGSEDVYFGPSATNKTLMWENHFTDSDVQYFRFCFYPVSGTDDGEDVIMSPRSTEDSGWWQGSGTAGGVRWDDSLDEIFIVCPTEGSSNSSSSISISTGRWHQITLLWDISVSGAPVCSLWLDKDSSGAADVTASGSGMVEDPGAIDGIRFRQNKNNRSMHIDMIQVDSTETDLVDVFGNDCVE